GTGNVRLLRLYASLDIQDPTAPSVGIDASILAGDPPVAEKTLRDAAVPSALVDYGAAPIELTGPTAKPQIVVTIAQATIQGLPTDLTEVYPSAPTRRLKPGIFQDLFLILDLERDPFAGS